MATGDSSLLFSPLGNSEEFLLLGGVVDLAFDPQQVFVFMQVAYEKGVLSKFLPILGDALRKLMQRTDKRVDEIFNAFDMATEETVQRVNRLVGHSGLLLKVASNPRLMSLTSRALDFVAVRQAAGRFLVWYMDMAIAKGEGTHVSLSQKLKELPSRLHPGAASREVPESTSW